ncbi:MAG: hypothetical protein IKP71_04810 [Candidatus Riflebacteria bacterium]|nr:hypothetical protein [Candidatus Riflebacteria bacterium]
MENIKIFKAEPNLINTIKSLWPFEIKENNTSIQIELGDKKKEIWAFPLVAGSEYLDDAIHSMEEHRKVIPAALNRCLESIDGIFMAGYYAKKLKDDNYEHGLVLIPANRGSKELNSRLLTDYCFEREELYKNMLSEEYFSQINRFLDAYKSVCKKYWIQDTKLINTSFKNRPVISDNDCKFPEKAAVSTWHTEVYPDFMRPVSMIGDIYIDFIICDHKLVSLQTEIEEDDTIWDLFEEESIHTLYSLQAEFLNNAFANEIKGWCVTTSFELSERKDFDYRTLYDIAVPDLKGNVVDQGFTIGWCGKIAFIAIGIDKPLYISPEFIKPLSDIGDFEQVGNDNKDFWRNRDIEYSRRFGSHNLIKVCDDLMTEQKAKEKLFEACKKVLQSCKNPLKEVQKGINKYILRYLKGLARGTYEKEASEFINEVNSAQICADLQECIYKILKMN